MPDPSAEQSHEHSPAGKPDINGRTQPERETPKPVTDAAAFARFVETTLLDPAVSVDMNQDPEISHILAETHYTADRATGPDRSTDIHIVQPYDTTRPYDTSYVVTRGDQRYTFRHDGNRMTATLRTRNVDDFIQTDVSDGDFTELKTAITDAVTHGQPTDRLVEVDPIDQATRSELIRAMPHGSKESFNARSFVQEIKRIVAGGATPAQIHESREIADRVGIQLALAYFDNKDRAMQIMRQLAATGVWTEYELLAKTLQMTDTRVPVSHDQVSELQPVSIETGRPVDPAEFATFLKNTLIDPRFGGEISPYPSESGKLTELHYAAGNEHPATDIHIVQPFFSDRPNEVTYIVTRGNDTYILTQEGIFDPTIHASHSTREKDKYTIQDIDDLSTIQAHIEAALEHGHKLPEAHFDIKVNTAIKRDLINSIFSNLPPLDIRVSGARALNGDLLDAIRHGATPVQIRLDAEITEYIHDALQHVFKYDTRKYDKIAQELAKSGIWTPLEIQVLTMRNYSEEGM